MWEPQMQLGELLQIFQLLCDLLHHETRKVHNFLEPLQELPFAECQPCTNTPIMQRTILRRTERTV